MLNVQVIVSLIVNHSEIHIWELGGVLVGAVMESPPPELPAQIVATRSIIFASIVTHRIRREIGGVARVLTRRKTIKLKGRDR